MNKTKQFNAEEKYVSPAAKVVEMDLQGLICTSMATEVGAINHSLSWDEDDE